MRRSELALFAPLVAIGAWIAVQAHDVRAASATHGSAAALGGPLPSSLSSSASSAGPGAAEGPPLDARPAGGDAAPARPEVRPSREPAPSRDPLEIRRRLVQNQVGTYIGDILQARDSNIARWPDRTSRPLRVWVQSGDALRDWNPVYPAQVRDAFTTWVEAGAPVPFTFVVDSSAADVHVTWVDHFDEQISGKTMWARDDNWWIVDANIAIALHHNHGEPLDGSAVRAIALHEVGHLLGLDHCADTTNIMTPRVRVRDLSPADKATMRLVYALPPGSVK
jgi:predicted Zn-dependent protease